ncbi:MAG: DUF3737 family protein [Lachnospiraceae bacterium]|nr:DUF3737 family protein [Lachnospiraceae bacterium]
MRKIISNQSYDEECALDNLREADVISCNFAGPADGEAPFRMARDVTMKDCSFSLRYPLWFAEDFTLEKSRADDDCRSGIWYCKRGRMEDCDWKGPKALRECRDIEIRNSQIVSQEFGWKSKRVLLEDVTIDANYLFLESQDVQLSRVTMTGKYSFQYMKNLEISDSSLDTKDAFWHSKNVTVRNCSLKGLYLGWFAKGLTLINCQISGFMPLCYCKDLKLIDCTMEDAEMAFKSSEVEASIKGHIHSYYTPKSGSVSCGSVDEILTEET